MRWEKLRQEVADSLLEKNSEEMPAFFVALKNIEEIIKVNYPDYLTNVEKVGEIDKETFIGMISGKRDEELNGEELFILDEIHERMRVLEHKSVPENFHQADCPNCGKPILIHQSELSSKYVHHSTCDTKVQNPLYSEKRERLVIFFCIAIILVSLVVAFIIKTDNNSNDKAGSRSKTTLQSNIKSYLNKVLNDPESYIPAEWSTPKMQSDGSCYIVHKYRAKNIYGGLAIFYTVFALDKNGNVKWHKDLYDEAEIEYYLER